MINGNGSKGMAIPLKSLYGYLPEFLFIFYSRRPRGRLLVNKEKIGIIGQKILPFPPIVKAKIAFCQKFPLEMVFVSKSKRKLKI